MANSNTKAQNVTNLTATYNIFITTNKDIADLFGDYQVRQQTFTDFHSSTYLQPHISREEHAHRPDWHSSSRGGSIGVYMTTADLNILEFSHAYNFGEGKNVDNTIKLKTFEPGMEILKKFFYMFMQEQMSALKISKWDLGRKDKDIRNQKKWTNARLKEYDKEGPAWKGQTKVGIKKAGQKAIEKKEKEMLAYLQRNSIGQSVYVAYGLGDDLNEWAGPFQAILGKIVYDNNGMEETITYEMATDHVAKQFENTSIMAEDKDFKPIDFIRPTIPLLGLDYTSKYKNKTSVGRPLHTKSFTPSFHDTIVKLISYYLHSVGISNHLIVLPNLDLLLAKQVAEAISLEDWHRLFDQVQDFGLLDDTVNTEYYAEGFKSYGTFTNALSEEYFAKYNLNVAKDLGEKIRALYLQLFAFGQIGVESWLTTHFATPNLDERVALLLKVFSRIGMKINKSEAWSSDNADAALVNFVDPSGSPYEIPESTAAYHAMGLQGRIQGTVHCKDPFFPADPSLIADALFSLELPFQHHKSGEMANQDGAYYMAPLLDIVNSVLQSGGNAAYSPTYFWENDVKLVNKLKEKFGGGTFAGYKQRFEQNALDAPYRFDSAGPTRRTLGKLRPDPTGSTADAYKHSSQANFQAWSNRQGPPPASPDNYFIFGDANLIKLFLYGEYSQVAAQNKAARLETTRAWEGIPFEFNVWTGGDEFFMMDPFWTRLESDLQLCTQDPEEMLVGTEVEIAGTGGLKAPFILPGAEEVQEKKYMNNLYKSYFYEMNQLIKGKAGAMGHFSEYDLDPEGRTFEFAQKLPDEFKLLTQTADPEMRSAISDLFDLGPIIFVANDKNANVLSYNFDNDQFIFSQFFGTIQEIYYNTHLRYSNTIAYPLYGKAGTDIQRSKLFGMLENLGQRSGRHGSLFKKVFSNLNLGVDTGRLATDMADIMILESNGTHRNSPIGRKSATLSMLQLFLSLFKHQYRGSITTLPMFKVANMGVLNRPGLVLFRSTGKVDTYSESPTTTMDFFTGLYKILGFRHTISNTDAKSEFIVYKDIEGMLG